MANRFERFKGWSQGILQKYAGGTKILVNKTVVKPTRRGSQDIVKWRTAIQQAEGYSQQRRSLFDLYEDIILDGYLTGVCEKRRMQITNTTLQFIDKEGKVIDVITDLTDTTYFETMLKEIINSKFWGHSLIELLWPAFNSNIKGESVLIPRKHVKPRWSIVTAEEFALEGYDYTTKQFASKLIEVGGAEDLGLFMKVAQYCIYKRGNFGDWAEFATIFGIPFRHATYNNEQSRAALEEGLEKAGPAGYMVTQEGTELKILTGNPNGNGADVFKVLREACNEEIALTILGNTMTTQDSKHGGYAQSQTHADGENDLITNDRRFVLRILNEQLTPYLKKMGYPVADGKWTFTDEEKLSLIERIKIDAQLDTKIPIPESYWYKTYGIPKPTAAELKAWEEKNKPPEPEADPEPEPPKPAPAKKSRGKLV